MKLSRAKLRVADLELPNQQQKIGTLFLTLDDICFTLAYIGEYKSTSDHLFTVFVNPMHLWISLSWEDEGQPQARELAKIPTQKLFEAGIEDELAETIYARLREVGFLGESQE